MATRGISGALLVAAVLAGAPSPAAAQQIIINNIEDVNFGTIGFPLGGNLRRNMTHCVGVTTAGRQFSLTITGPSNAGGFTATNGTDTPNILIEYNDRRGSGWLIMLPGQSRTFTGERINRCLNGRQRQRVRITLQPAQINGISAGNYSTTLTLLVVPQ